MAWIWLHYINIDMFCYVGTEKGIAIWIQNTFIISIWLYLVQAIVLLLNDAKASDKNIVHTYFDDIYCFGKHNFSVSHSFLLSPSLSFSISLSLSPSLPLSFPSAYLSPPLHLSPQNLSFAFALFLSLTRSFLLPMLFYNNARNWRQN